MKTTEELKRSEATRKPQAFRWLLVLPLVTLVIFLSVSLVSFLEIGSRKPQARIATRPASAEVLARYEAQSRELGKMREDARAKLTPEALLGSVSPKKAEEIPAQAKLLSDLLSLEKRTPGSAGAVFKGLLPLWRKAKDLDGAERRLSRIEAVMSQALLLTGGEFTLGGDERRDLLDLLEGSIGRGTKFPGSIVLVLGRVGEPSDLARLRALKEKPLLAQLSFEIDRLIALLQKKEVARG